jgi:flagellar biosynthesis GTPase FlhF
MRYAFGQANIFEAGRNSDAVKLINGFGSRFNDAMAKNDPGLLSDEDWEYGNFSYHKFFIGKNIAKNEDGHYDFDKIFIDGVSVNKICRDKGISEELHKTVMVSGYLASRQHSVHAIGGESGKETLIPLVAEKDPVDFAKKSTARLLWNRFTAIFSGEAARKKASYEWRSRHIDVGDRELEQDLLKKAESDAHLESINNEVREIEEQKQAAKEKQLREIEEQKQAAEKKQQEEEKQAEKEKREKEIEEQKQAAEKKRQEEQKLREELRQLEEQKMQQYVNQYKEFMEAQQSQQENVKKPEFEPSYEIMSGMENIMDRTKRVPRRDSDIRSFYSATAISSEVVHNESERWVKNTLSWLRKNKEEPILLKFLEENGTNYDDVERTIDIGHTISAKADEVIPFIHACTINNAIIIHEEGVEPKTFRPLKDLEEDYWEDRPTNIYKCGDRYEASADYFAAYNILSSCIEEIQKYKQVFIEYQNKKGLTVGKTEEEIDQDFANDFDLNNLKNTKEKYEKYKQELEEPKKQEEQKKQEEPEKQEEQKLPEASKTDEELNNDYINSDLTEEEIEQNKKAYAEYESKKRAEELNNDYINSNLTEEDIERSKQAHAEYENLKEPEAGKTDEELTKDYIKSDLTEEEIEQNKQAFAEYESKKKPEKGRE